MFTGTMGGEHNVTIPVAAAVLVGSAAIFLLWKRKNGGCPFSFCGSTKAGPQKTLLDENAKYSFPLIEKIIISHDTRKFRFKLPSDKHVLGLPTGQHVYLSAKVEGKLVVRPYTPVSSDEDRGFVELMIKVYFRGTNERFPEGGKMSQYLESLSIGDSIDFRGPSGKIVYEGQGTFAVRADNKSVPKQRHYTQLGLIAGGTGITPMLQIIAAVLRDAQDKTKLFLLFANQTEEDILCRKELDDLATAHPDRFKVWYTVDRPPAGWTFSKGFIDADMISGRLPPPTDDTAILMCGPPPMINFACMPNLDKLAYAPDNRLIF